MYRVACPACGADVRFHATSSVLAVCSYCQSTLLRDAGSVRDIGKMAALLDAGLITQADYDTAKADVLKKLVG